MLLDNKYFIKSSIVVYILTLVLFIIKFRLRSAILILNKGNKVFKALKDLVKLLARGLANLKGSRIFILYFYLKAS